MKGDPKLLEVLNDLLADELTAISQYMVHSEVCDQWGYGVLHGAIEKRAFDEMHHAESLIERILFLEGRPVVSNLKQMFIGAVVPDMIKNDQRLEWDAIQAYRKAIAFAGEVGDEATADFLVGILKQEEDHLDWVEKQLAQIDQMGLEIYLTQQVGE
jgi:bacterioferritin